MGLLRCRSDQAHEPRDGVSAAPGALRGQGLVSLTSLVDAFGALAPWPAAGDLAPQEWERSIVTAAAVQRADPDEAEHAIAEFLGRGTGFGAAADETRLFLLLRVVFDLPERAPEEERRSFKGWVNWPPPAPDGTVSLAWPITWNEGHPALVDPYVGSEGPRYAAVEEHRDLLERFRFRSLRAAN